MRAAEQQEQRYLRRADHVLAVSQTDRSTFGSFLDQHKLTVIQTGVDVDYFKPAPDMERRDWLVFTSSLDWLPNEDGGVYFIREILPLIPHPTASTGRFASHRGAKASAHLESLAARQENAELTGWVEDVRPFLARGAVCRVPLRIGSSAAARALGFLKRWPWAKLSFRPFDFNWR
jgi:glycosyltransferase involved in cell wall biosynthesis